MHLCWVLLLCLINHLRNFLVPETSDLVVLEVLVLKGGMLPRKHGFSELEVDTACWQVWAFSITNQQREKGGDHYCQG